MIKLDSITTETPLDCLVNHNDNFVNSQQSEKGVLTSDRMLWKKPLFGIKSIAIDQLNNTLVIDASAKVLKDQYYDMINLNTIDRFVNEINKSGVIQIDADKFINQSIVRKVDTTINIHPDKPLETYFSSLSYLPITDKYNVGRYKGVGNRGAVFAGTQKTFKERQIFYDKLKDIFRDKELRKVVPGATLEKQFTNVLRVETNFTDFKHIRKYFNSDNKLIQMLQSEATPNLAVFDKITTKVPLDLRLFKEWEGMKFYEIEKLEGMKHIIELFNYDIGTIKTFIEARVGGNVSRYIKRYTETLMSMQGKRDVIDTSAIDELRLLMKVA